MGLISVAERLLERGEVTFANQLLRVIKPTQQLYDDMDDSCENREDDDDDDDDESDCSGAAAAVASPVVVSNIPKSLSEDFLFMFLENSRRSGGGEIADMQFDQKSATAIVTFASPQGNQHFSTSLHFRCKTWL